MSNASQTRRDDTPSDTSVSGTQASASPRGGALHSRLRTSDYAGGAAMLQPVQRQQHGQSDPATSIADQTPAAVDLQNLSIGFGLPAGKTLTGNWQYEVRTERDTFLRVRVSPEQLRISSSPTLFIDAQWPASNMQFYSAGVDFARGETFANVHTTGGLGSGFIDLTDRAERSLRGCIDSAISGTAMARPGYNPLQDDAILATLANIRSNFEALPQASDSSDVGVGDLRSPEFGGTLAMREAFTREQDGVGLTIPAGGVFSVRVRGGGDVNQLLQARSAAGRAQAFELSGIDLQSDAIQLLKNGNPAVQLQSLSVARGGRVTVGRFQLLGTGATLAGIESLIRILGGGLGAAARGAPPELGMRHTAASGGAEPEIVRGMSRQVIEDGLSQGLRQLVMSNRNAIPGVDLAQALGIS